MKEMLTDIIGFIGSLSLNDIIFFTAVMCLLVLSVTMIYLIKVSKEPHEEEISDFSDELLAQLATINDEDSLPIASDEPETLIDLKTLTANLENQKYNISTDKYEEEQEEKAIISYDELIKTKSNLKINYAEETEENGLSVKRVDLENLTSVDNSPPIKTTNVTLVSFEKEEAFLQALKDLQNLLS